MLQESSSEPLMPIPDYQTLMLPVLHAVAEGKEHVVNDIVTMLADQFQLTKDDRAATLSNGETVFHNRVWWARTYLLKAGLVESPMRGMIRITSRGLGVLEKPPSHIDNKFLMQFSEFEQWKLRPGTKKETEKEVAEEIGESGTPQEIIESNHERLHENLAQELLEKVKNCSPEFFENVVINLLVAMGYGGSPEDARRVGKSGDGGIDGVIKEDKLGLDEIYVQAKRWGGTVGRPVVQSFVGSLEGQKARKGVFITTSQFSNDAREFVKHLEKKVVLLDGEELAALMIEHGIGVADVARYDVKRIDSDYFAEG